MREKNIERGGMRKILIEREREGESWRIEGEEKRNREYERGRACITKQYESEMKRNK